MYMLNMPRSRSPCKDISRRLPNYKSLARDLPKNSKETLKRYRYQAGEEGVPCRTASENTPGRTTCYTPTDHSRRRKTCNLLIDPNSPFAPSFRPGLYLYGHPDFNGHDLVCTYKNLYTWQNMDVNTLPGQGQALPDPFTVAVLGPYADPYSKKLVVKCIGMEMFAPENIRGRATNLGNAFVGDDYLGVTAVPTTEMLDSFVRQLSECGLSEIAQTIQSANGELKLIQKDCEQLANLCDNDDDLLRKVRTVARCFYEMSLYSRRWAGPDRKVPITAIPDPVGYGKNPLSTKLRGKFVIPSITGVRLKNDGNIPADMLDPGYGMLTGMQQAYGQSILMIYNALTSVQQIRLRRAFRVGYKFYMIDDSGYWLLEEEPNTVDPPNNGNPPQAGRPFPLDLFTMYFGTPTSAHGLFAYSSVQGTNSYCLQIASSHAGRTVLTLLPYLYKSRPVWAAADGPWNSLHT